MAHRKDPEEGEQKPRDINELVAANLKLILGERSPEDYCRYDDPKMALKYISGKKKGQKVAPRSLRYAVDGEQSPRLDLIAAVAAREELQPYQLLFFDFDPSNAPLMVSKEQQEVIESIRRSAGTLLSTTGQFPSLRK